MFILSIHVIRRPFLIPIFAFSASLRESIPHPHLCLLSVFARSLVRVAQQFPSPPGRGRVRVA